MQIWYFLDEDCRRDAPKDETYCARCKKLIKPMSTFHRIALHQESMWFRPLKEDEQPVDKETLGALGNDCWKAVQEWGQYDEQLNKIQINGKD